MDSVRILHFQAILQSNQDTCLQEIEKILKNELVTISKSSKGEDLESFNRKKIMSFYMANFVWSNCY